MRILVGGRAAHLFEGLEIPVERIVIEAATNHLHATLPNLTPGQHCTVESLVQPGDPVLSSLAWDRLANDTISCCACWPRTPLEDAVIDAARFLNSDLASIPLGQDVKVSGYRLKSEHRMIVAAPFLALETPNLGRYKQYKDSVIRHLIERASMKIGASTAVTLNAADDASNGHAYLTLTGTSAEMGDDGSVGRGNRPSGLMAPLRPSTTPAAGKNPSSHPGKLYNILAQRIARLSVEENPSVTEARVTLLATIGRPLKIPTLANIGVRMAVPPLRMAVEDNIKASAYRTLDQVDEIVRGLIEECPRLY